MKLRSAAVLASVLASALCTNPAHAAASASASTSVVRIQLIDLNLNDGITPSLQLLANDPYLSQASVTYLQQGAWHGPVTSSLEHFEPLSAETSLGSVLSGSASKTGTSLDTLALSSNLSASASNIDRASAEAKSRSNFFLSPNTKLSITFDFNIAADSVAGESKSAYAIAGAEINQIGASRPFGPYKSLDYHEFEPGTSYGTPGFLRWTAEMSSGATGSNLYVATWAWSYVNPAPVPEPSTWGMVLVGLGLAGAAVRRTRKQRATCRHSPAV